MVDSKKFASRFISSDRNLAISSSILRISLSKRSRMLENSVSMTLKSPSLMGMLRLLVSAIFICLVCVVEWSGVELCAVLLQFNPMEFRAWRGGGVGWVVGCSFLLLSAATAALCT